MVQHQKLSEPILTPTTKGGDAVDSTDDVPIGRYCIKKYFNTRTIIKSK